MNRLLSFSISQFRGLSDFRLDFPENEENNLLCLIGLNGTGKSTVLQAVDFVGQLFRKDGEGSLPLKASEICNKYQRRKVINIKICADMEGKRLEWDAAYNATQRKCTVENLFIDGQKIFSVGDGRYIVLPGNRRISNSIDLTYHGSLLSVLKESVIRQSVLIDFAKFMGNIHFCSFSPLELKKPSSKKALDNVGKNGENLAACLAGKNADVLLSISEKLRSFYPWLESIETKTNKSGIHSLLIKEKPFEEDISIIKEENGKQKQVGGMSPSSFSLDIRFACDGLARLLGILAEQKNSPSIFLLDEIENGFNPQLIEALVKFLCAFEKQVVLTTHNPLIINFLPKDLARESVVFMYRDADGCKGKRFFSLEEIADKLRFMGPGEAYLDTDLYRLADLCAGRRSSYFSDDSSPKVCFSE